jgi:hypothetical protein
VRVRIDRCRASDITRQKSVGITRDDSQEVSSAHLKHPQTDAPL